VKRLVLSVVALALSAATARDLQILYTLGDELANSRQWPNWSKDSEFRAARDASAAERQ